MATRPPFVRSPYNYDMNLAGDESGLRCVDVSLAVQDQRDEVDINTIVRRFGLTGKLPDDVQAPSYGDFVGVGDYHEAMNAVAKANEAFDAMPAEVRARFENDPGLFVDFCSDPENIQELKQMKLLLPEAVKRLDDEAAAKQLALEKAAVERQRQLDKEAGSQG